jgi:hypothetical protein
LSDLGRIDFFSDCETSSRSRRPAHPTKETVMAISIFDLSIPALIRGLTNLSVMLDRAEARATEGKFDPAAFLQARLFPDMLAFVSQVQIACDTAKGAAARLANLENPKHADEEASFADLQARIRKTLAFLEAVTSEQLRGAELREIVLQFPTNTLKFNGLDYLTRFVLPNFYFHLSIAYALLRSNGVVLGKRDYLGAIQ